MNVHVRCCLMLLAALLGCPSPVVAVDTPRALAVLPYSNATGDSALDALAENLPDVLGACMGGLDPRWVVVERGQVEAAVNELALDLQGLTGAGAGRVGAMTAATHVARGSLLKTRSGFEINTVVFDVTTSTLAAAATTPVEGRDVVSAICDRAAPNLVEALGTATPATATAPQSDEAEGTNLAAADARRQALLLTGISHYYNGQSAQAAGAFFDYTAAWPEQSSGHYWLAQAFAGAGLTELARTQATLYLTRFPGGTELSDIGRLLKALPAAAEDPAPSPSPGP